MSVWSYVVTKSPRESAQWEEKRAELRVPGRPTLDRGKQSGKTGVLEPHRETIWRRENLPTESDSTESSNKVRPKHCSSALRVTVISDLIAAGRVRSEGEVKKVRQQVWTPSSLKQLGSKSSQLLDYIWELVPYGYKLNLLTGPSLEMQNEKRKMQK